MKMIGNVSDWLSYAGGALIKVADSAESTVAPTLLLHLGLNFFKCRQRRCAVRGYATETPPMPQRFFLCMLSDLTPMPLRS